MAVTITGIPFDGQSISEAQWSQMAQNWVGDGVRAHYLNELLVVNSTGMQVDVRTGQATVQGHLVSSGVQQTLPIAAADPTFPRADRVVVRLNWATNVTQLDVLTGSPAASPSPPVPTRNATVWEISLARINVGAAASSIAPADVVDERYNPSVCGFSYSASPCARCRSATKPLTWPVGGLIWVEDTNTVEINTGTYTTPIWTRSGPAAFANPAYTFGTTTAPGSATSYVRSDAQIALFDAVVPVTQAFGDAAGAGAVNFAARRDHKHGMPVLFATSTPNPAASNPGDAAAPGASVWAARLDHVHARETTRSVGAYKTSNTSFTGTTLTNDPHLFVPIAAGGVYAFQAQLFVVCSSVTPDYKFSFILDNSSGDSSWEATGHDDGTTAVGQIVYLSQLAFGLGAMAIWPLYAGVTVGVRVQGLVRNTGAATTFRLMNAQQISDANPITLFANSWLLLNRVN